MESNEKLYDELKGFIKIVSTKAILFLTDTAALWIPKSLVKGVDSLNLNDSELEITIEVERGFCEKKGLSNGY